MSKNEVRIETDAAGTRLMLDGECLLAYPRRPPVDPESPAWRNVLASRARRVAPLVIAVAMTPAAAAGAEVVRVGPFAAFPGPQAAITPLPDQYDEETCIQFLVASSLAIAGNTIERQGPRAAIERLHPEFRARLCALMRSWKHGVVRIFSAYRPPGFGVGGFRDKFDSCHSYGLAVDVAGIGRAGSRPAREFHRHARTHGVIGPYGPGSRAEFNHLQLVPQRACGRYRPLRASITADGPPILQRMWALAAPLIKGAELLAAELAKKSKQRLAKAKPKKRARR